MTQLQGDIVEQSAGEPVGGLEAMLAKGRLLIVTIRRRLAPTRVVFASVTRLGWLVVVATILCWLAGVLLGWDELDLAAGVGVVVIVIGVVFLIGRLNISVEIEPTATRCSVGDPVPVAVRYRNEARVRSQPLTLDIPVGKDVATFRVGSLAPGEGGEDVFVIEETRHRGVIPIGPTSATKGDALGLFRRERAVSDQKELIVHPRSIGLGPLGGGLLRDLEGLTTAQLSPSDLAFHSLRDYVVGDDRRLIHWKSSAKVGGLQVRQFLDTRRSSVSIVLDATQAHYVDGDEFELACEAAASLAIRAIRDGLPCSLLTGDHVATDVVPVRILDVLARVELAQRTIDVDRLVMRSVEVDAGATLAVMISGSTINDEVASRALLRFSTETRVVDLRVGHVAQASVRSVARVLQLRINELRQLPFVLGLGDRG